MRFVSGSKLPGIQASAPARQAQRQVAPGVAARVPGARHGRGAPQLGAGLGIVGGDEADVVLVPLASRHPGDHLALHDDRTAGVPVAEAAVGHLVLPDQLARPCVEGDQLGPARAGEEPVAVDRDAPPRHAGTAVDGQILRPPGPPAGGSAPRCRSPVAASSACTPLRLGTYITPSCTSGVTSSVPRLRRPGPDELQVADVVPVDLVERAVALAVRASGAS